MKAQILSALFLSRALVIVAIASFLGSSGAAQEDGDGSVAFDLPVPHAARVETLDPIIFLPLVAKDAVPPIQTTDVTFAVVEGVPLTLDAYLPTTPAPHPAVILIHGGACQFGDKISHARFGELMVEWGYAAFAINHRLAPEFPFPAAVADVQCALAWVREHAAKYGVDPDRIALMGTSSGGHLAALAGLAAVPSAPTASWQPSCGDPEADLRVQAIISCFGPLDLVFHANYSEPAGNIVARFLGQPCEDAPDVCAAASPMTYVTADAADDVVGCENSERMYAVLQAVAAEVTYLPIEGAQHSFIFKFHTPEAQMALDAMEYFLAETFSAQ